MLAKGCLNLSAIARLGPHLTEANRDAVLARAAGKTKGQIEKLIAELSPKPDLPTVMRRLPERQAKTKPLPALVPERVTVLHTPAPARSMPPAQRPVVEPLAPARYKVQFTASAELHDKLERLRALMRSSVPDGTLAAIIDAAVTEKLEQLEARRFAKTKAPRKSIEQTDTSPASRYIPAPVRRAVRERDGDQCTFVTASGKRCTERGRLEFPHRRPFGRGGDHSPDNVQLLCRTHNGYLAELDYGQDVMERYRRSGDRVSEPVSLYRVMLDSRSRSARSHWPV